MAFHICSSDNEECFGQGGDNAHRGQFYRISYSKWKMCSMTHLSLMLNPHQAHLLLTSDIKC